MTRNSLLLVSLSAVLASGAAVGATQADKTVTAPAPHAMSLDKNGDGLVDRSEAAAHPRLAKHFDSIDGNKDGTLSTDEMKQARMTRRASGKHNGHRGHRGMGMGMKLDVDKDGRISRAEAAAQPKFAARFDTMDVNKDGFVDRVDFQARRAQRRNDCFDKADTDRDGKLSRDEFTKAGEICHPQMRHGKLPHMDMPTVGTPTKK